jgi:cAMP phosphodiesterase
MKFVKAVLLSCLLCFQALISAGQGHAFEIVPLGITGGGDESNLSSYAIGIGGENAFVCLDAGTIRTGIQKAIENRTWNEAQPVILHKRIKGYLISHPHLDHVSGLILNAPDDTVKQIYGTATCLDVIRDHYFSWKSWANFSNEGEKPTLNKYSLQRLTPGKRIPIAGTSMHVTAYTLSHSSPGESTAFLVDAKDQYVLYLGDTGSDKIEKSTRLSDLWQVISPLVASGKLKAIFIEVSYPNEQPDHLLFGHLTPKLLMEELTTLQKQVMGRTLKDFPVVVTHMKPVYDNESKIKRQLQESNAPGVRLIFPQQGKRLEF